MKRNLVIVASLLLAAIGLGQPASIEAIIQRVDRNGDGKLSRDEAGDSPWFEQLDGNRDGIVDASELDRLRTLLRQRRGDDEPAARRAPSIKPEELKQITSGPEILKPGDVGIGRQVPDVSFTDLANKTHRLGALAAPRGLVVALTSATCPVSKRYLPSLATLEQELASLGIGLLLVNPFASETPEGVRAQLAEHRFAAPYVRGSATAIAGALQARTTTEVFLLDATRTLIYRGALDDQYGIDYSLPEPRRRYLRDALDALRRNARPAVAATAAPGCELDLDGAPAPAATPVVYHRDVARILAQNCVECHRDGGVAPFALDNLAAVKDRARTIRRVITEGTMPPWFAAPAADNAPSPWANDRSLSARDKSDLLAWLASPERPTGDPADAPAQRAFPPEWSIGQPDLIVPLSRAYEIPASGVLPYQFDVAEATVAEDRWVTAYEILPSARDVVHHVLVNVHEPGTSLRDREEGTGYWAAYVPGNGANVYPEGFARRLPAGSRISFQIHYTPSGRATSERLRIGLVFAKSPPQFEVKTLPIPNRRLRIPAGAAAHRETITRTVPFDVPVTSLMAHMHVRGKAFRYDVAYPDGTDETLLDIPRYDFNWQLRYELKTPKLIPRGSVMTLTAVYDNSPANRANPDPTKNVRWGPQTFDEMMIGYLEYFVPLGGGAAAGEQ